MGSVAALLNCGDEESWAKINSLKWCTQEMVRSSKGAIYCHFALFPYAVRTNETKRKGRRPRQRDCCHAHWPTTLKSALKPLVTTIQQEKQATLAEKEKVANQRGQQKKGKTIAGLKKMAATLLWYHPLAGLRTVRNQLESLCLVVQRQESTTMPWTRDVNEEPEEEKEPEEEEDPAKTTEALFR